MLLVAEITGVLGQTYDRDNMAVDGARDSKARLDDGSATAARRHAGGIITTRSNAQGGIEGQLSDYRVSDPFETRFAYSRFDAAAAAPRNTSKLDGRKRRIPTPAAAAAPRNTSKLDGRKRRIPTPAY